jgi:hypothetical protein
MHRALPWVVPLLAVVLLGCSEDELTLSDGPDPAYEAEMFRSVLRRLTEPDTLPTEGDWPEDFGDSNFYGPGFFFRYGAAGNNALQIDLAQQSHAFNSKLVSTAMQNLGLLMSKLEDVMMSIFGLMEGYHHEADPTTLALIDKAVDVLNTFAEALAYYPESGMSGYAVDTYGPTSINASLALVNLEYALQVGGARKNERVTTAEEILDKAYTKAFDSTAGYYRFSSTRDGLFLYPNITQMLAHLRAHQITGKPLFLQRATDLHAAIQPLKVKGEGRYRSPYSAEYMGAKTDDYTTLSSQNFTMMSLSLLYRFTQEQRFEQEILDILAFIRTHLLQDGRVLHHWMDGRLAEPADPEYYCTGCNLQLLYILWRLEELMQAGAAD